MNEKLKALLGADYKDGMTDDEAVDIISNRETKAKASFDKTSSELASLKKEHESHLTDEEKAKAANDEALKQLKAENDSLKHDALVSKLMARYTKMGMDEKLAKETAEAYVKGDSEKVLDNEGKFIEIHDANLKKDLLQHSPTPPAGGDPNHVTTKEEFKAMGYEQRVELQKNNPTLFAELSK